MSDIGVHEYDIGTVLRVTIVDQDATAIDVSGATTKEIILQKPRRSGQGNPEKLTKTASFTNSGTDGKIEYVSVSGDLTPYGTWKIQGRVVISGNEWKSEIGTFEVHQNL